MTITWIVVGIVLMYIAGWIYMRYVPICDWREQRFIEKIVRGFIGFITLIPIIYWPVAVLILMIMFGTTIYFNKSLVNAFVNVLAVFLAWFLSFQAGIEDDDKEEWER